VKEAKMQAAVRRVAAIVATLVFLVGPGTAQAANPAKLLAKYQPVTVFDARETLRPAGADAFVAGARLQTVAGVPALNFTACSPPAGLAAVDCYAAAASGAPSVVYGRIVKDGRATVLQYWYFYFHNFYSYEYPPSNLLWQAHEGDWEVVNVVLSPGKRPRHVGYSQHCDGEVRRWSETPRWRVHHPIVYVAIGSHANYFEAGAHPIDARCLPPQVLPFFGPPPRLPFPNDVAGEGPAAGPARFGGDVTAIERIGDPSDPAWVAFPGIWGELQYFRHPAVGTVPLGLSPVGPAFHDVWREPVDTLERWAAG
jgi:hypothetical protein